MKTLLIAFLIFFYFLPTIVGRKKSNAGAIFALNFFLGFTLIGWVVSLVWALTNDNKPQTIIVNNNIPDNIHQTTNDVSNKIAEKRRELYGDLNRIKSLHDQNIISEEIYNQQKDSLLNKIDILSHNESGVSVLSEQQIQHPVYIPERKKSTIWIWALVLLLLAIIFYLLYYKGIIFSDNHKQDKEAITNQIEKTYFDITNDSYNYHAGSETPFYNLNSGEALAMRFVSIIALLSGSAKMEAKNIDVYNFIDSSSAQVKYDLVREIKNVKDTLHIDMIAKKIGGDWKLDGQKAFGDDKEEQNKPKVKGNETNYALPSNADNDDNLINKSLLNSSEHAAYKVTYYNDTDNDSSGQAETDDRYLILGYKKIYMIVNKEVVKVWHEKKYIQEDESYITETKEGDTFTQQFDDFDIDYKSGKIIHYSCNDIPLNEVQVQDRFLK
jgi:hypothetical protein